MFPNLPLNAVARRSLWCSFRQIHDNTKGVQHVPEQTL